MSRLSKNGRWLKEHYPINSIYLFSQHFEFSHYRGDSDVKNGQSSSSRIDGRKSIIVVVLEGKAVLVFQVNLRDQNHDHLKHTFQFFRIMQSITHSANFDSWFEYSSSQQWFHQQQRFAFVYNHSDTTPNGESEKKSSLAIFSSFGWKLVWCWMHSMLVESASKIGINVDYASPCSNTSRERIPDG